MEELEKIRQKAEEDEKIGEALLGISTQVIFKEVMPLVKDRKVSRFNEIIKEFSEARIKKI